MTRDIRASFIVNGGVDLPAVGKAFGNADQKSRTRYSHFANDTLLTAAEAAVNKLDVDWTVDT